jgi:type II secretory pathway predicted ATPase ExeA
MALPTIDDVRTDDTRGNSMVEKHFGLNCRPFPPTPDTCLYYPASTHETALGALERGIADDEGILLLTGVPGTGKTLLGYVLVERLENQVVSAFLTNSHFADRSALLQAILYDLGLPHEEGSEQVLRLRLTEQLLKTCSEERRTLLVIDEAHHLSGDLLEELRLLANLEAGRGKALQVVLIAQPAVAQTLQQPGLEALQQRLAVRAALGALETEEAYDYLLHHLRLAGGKPEKIFDETALEVLARGTNGLPRFLNQAAHQALALAQAGAMEQVDAEAALEALALLGLTPAEPAVETENNAQNESPHPNIQDFRRPA